MHFIIKDLHIGCDGHEVEELIADNDGYYHASFEFDEAWAGMAKTARFICEDGYRDSLIGPDDTCLVPSEVLHCPGLLHVGVYSGEYGESLLTTNSVCVRVSRSIFTDSNYGLPDDPDPNIYTQIVNMAADALKMAKSVEERANSGEFNGRDGKDAVTDSAYNPASTNAQSGVAVAQALSTLPIQPLAALKLTLTPRISDGIYTAANDIVVQYKKRGGDFSFVPPTAGFEPDNGYKSANIKICKGSTVIVHNASGAGVSHIHIQAYGRIIDGDTGLIAPALYTQYSDWFYHINMPDTVDTNSGLTLSGEYIDYTREQRVLTNINIAEQQYSQYSNEAQSGVAVAQAIAEVTIKGNGAPTTETVAAIGCRYIDMDSLSKNTYTCTNIGIRYIEDDVSVPIDEGSGTITDMLTVSGRAVYINGTIMGDGPVMYCKDSKTGVYYLVYDETVTVYTWMPDILQEYTGGSQRAQSGVAVEQAISVKVLSKLKTIRIYSTDTDYIEASIMPSVEVLADE